MSQAGRKPKANQPVIRRGVVYPLSEFARRMGWCEHALRQARLAGLPVIYFGRQGFVRGTSADAWFARLEAEQQAGNGGRPAA